MNNADGIRIEEKTYFKATTVNQELSQALTTGGAKTIERTDLEERENIKKTGEVYHTRKPQENLTGRGNLPRRGRMATPSREGTSAGEEDPSLYERVTR